MNEIVARWDWVCVGIVIGVLAVKVGKGINALLQRWFGNNQLKLDKALREDIARIEKKIFEGSPR